MPQNQFNSERCWTLYKVCGEKLCNELVNPPVVHLENCQTAIEKLCDRICELEFAAEQSKRKLSFETSRCKIIAKPKRGGVGCISYEKNGISLDSSDFELKFFHCNERFEIKSYDDGIGNWYIFRDTSGIRGIVRADSWESAWETINDEILTPLTAEEYAELLKDNPQYTEDSGELPEGYEYMPNFGSSCGIVAHDLNGESLDVLTPELIESLEITVHVCL